MKNILYLSSCIEHNQFEIYRDIYKIDYGLQQQKFHEGFINGFIQNGCEINVVSHIQTNRSFIKKLCISFKKKRVSSGMYFSIFTINIPILSQVVSLISMFFKSITVCNSKTVIIVDYVNYISLLLACLLKKLKKPKVVFQITDLPNWYYDAKIVNKSYTLLHRIHKYLLKYADSYQFVIENINEIEEFQGKPYFVCEGCVQFPEDVVKQKKKIVVYSGIINTTNGIDRLLNAYKKVNPSRNGYELHLYGKCTDEHLIDDMNTIQGVFYKGTRSNSEIIEIQRNASLLINTRLTEFEFNRHSFPMKTIEYISAGTAIASTKIYCLTKTQGYKDLIYFFNDDSTDSISDGLIDLLINNNHEYLQEKGKQIFEYFKEIKNEKDQTKRYLNWIEEKLGVTTL